MKDAEQKLEETIRALKSLRERMANGKATKAQEARERQLTRRYVRLVQSGL